MGNMNYWGRATRSGVGSLIEGMMVTAFERSVKAGSGIWVVLLVREWVGGIVAARVGVPSACSRSLFKMSVAQGKN